MGSARVFPWLWALREDDDVSAVCLTSRRERLGKLFEWQLFKCDERWRKTQNSCPFRSVSPNPALFLTEFLTLYRRGAVIRAVQPSSQRAEKALELLTLSQGGLCQRFI